MLNSSQTLCRHRQNTRISKCNHASMSTLRCLCFQLVIVPTKVSFQYAEQCINHILMLKAFIDNIKPIWQALAGAGSAELQKIRQVCVELGWRFAFAKSRFQLCAPENYSTVAQLITDTLNADVSYSTQPIELRSQRVYAIKVIASRCTKLPCC
jgi:DNA mismatch repair protein MSH4